MPESTPLPTNAADRLQAMTRRLTRGRSVRHALLAIGNRRGELLWFGAEGAADEAGAPFTPETPWFLASVTKLYIATAVLRLVERGQVALDAPMSDYLPPELTDGLHRMDGVDRTDQITVRPPTLRRRAPHHPVFGHQLPASHRHHRGGVRRPPARGLRPAHLPAAGAGADLSSRDPATARLMRAHFNPLAFSFSLRPVGPGRPTEYGLGMIRFRMPRIFTGLRQAPALYGHTGVTGSWLFHVPELELILTGTVDQVMGAPVPYRFVPRLVLALREMGVRGG